MSPAPAVEIAFWREREITAQKSAKEALRNKVRAVDKGDYFLAGQYYLEECEAERRQEQAVRNILRLTAELDLEQTELVLGGPF